MATVPSEEQNVWTVTQVNRLVADLIQQSFYPLWVRGEVSNLTIHRSGHVYFSLKDAESQVNVAFFRAADMARQLGLQEGEEVDVWGRLGVYIRRGQYQLVAQKLQPRGTGALRRRYEALKEKLRSEGLFDEERKRPVPGRPKCVGLVTSPQGAALRDFLQVLERRFSGMHVRIYPAAVQGDKAAGELVAGVRYFNRMRNCDVIVLTRGGGSLEDLWPFNEESVARAVVGSDLPVISAVGHEVDYTICDFVADLRVPTPSAAAELVVGEKVQLLNRVHSLRSRLKDQVALKVSRLRHRTDRAAEHAVFRDPINRVRTYQQQVDELSSRLARSARTFHADAKRRLSEVDGKLRTMNPKHVMRRGYAVLVEPESRAVIRKADQVEPGSALTARLLEGELSLRCIEVHPEKNAVLNRDVSTDENRLQTQSDVDGGQTND